MHLLRRLTALALCLVVMVTAAMAEVSFLPGLGDWNLEELPLEITVSADVKEHMPFDEQRLAQLTAMLDRMTLRMNWQSLSGETQSSVALLMDGQELLAMEQQQNAQETMMQLSALPDTTYAAVSSPLDMLLEGDTQAVIPFGVDVTAYAWLEEGYQLLNNLSPALDAYVKEKSVSTTIENMGKASVCQDYTVSVANAAELTGILTSLCPEGRLKALLATLTFSGKQTLRVYRTAEGVPLRMEYNGNCGTDAAHLRDVQLIWRLRRDDTAWRDEVTLKSPALKGTDKNTIVWTLSITKPQSTTRRMKGTFEAVTVSNKAKTTLEVSFDLLNEMKDGIHHVTGEAEVKQLLPDEDAWEKLAFAPDVTLEGTADRPLVAGSLEVSRYQGSRLVEQAVLQLQLQRTDYLGWTMRDHTVDLSVLSAEQLTEVQQQVQQAVASVLVCGILRSMGAEATYLLQELPEETVRQLLEVVGK